MTYNRWAPDVEPTQYALEVQAYQAMLEAHRVEPDNEELYADMLKAKAAMEVAWLVAHPQHPSL